MNHPLRAYVDASYKDGRIGIGIAIFEGPSLVTLIAQSEYGSNSFYGEATALKKAMSIICLEQGHSNIQILTDCKGCVDTCTLPENEFVFRVGKMVDQKTALALESIRGFIVSSSKVNLTWVRGHNRNLGNDYADFAANKARFVQGKKILYDRQLGLPPPPIQKRKALAFGCP